MAYFTQLNEDNIVINVLFIENELCLDDNQIESEQKGVEYLQSIIPGRFVQTSYNGNFRKQYAGIGYFYDEVNDVFIAEKPFESWILNEDFDWQAPIERPTDGFYIWNEDDQSWIQFESATPNI
jgi:hypothetical protein